MWVLGVNAPPLGWHDPSACLVDGNGHVVALVEEERPTRRKHALHRYPHSAVAECLDIAGITPEDIDVVAVGWQLPMHAGRDDLDELDPPVLGRSWRFHDDDEYLVACLGPSAPRTRLPEVRFISHHYAHACSAFYASPYTSASVVVIDGNGDSESVSIYHAQERSIVRRARWPIASSPGYMYGAVSEMLGLSFLEAGKTMGLAAYGRAAGLEPAVTLKPNSAGFELPFDLPRTAEWPEVSAAWLNHFSDLGLSLPTPVPAGELHRSSTAIRLALSAQNGIEETLSALVASARSVTSEDVVCLAGGVALNCSANGLLPEPVFVPPVPNDSGIALGAAWAVAPPRDRTAPLSPYLGRSVAELEVDEALGLAGLSAVDVESDALAERLMRGQFGAVVVGRAEVGPRALCHRSILALPDRAEVRDEVNEAKGRESWRPLSPAGLADAEGSLWSSSDHLHRYMVGAARATPAAETACPATIHVDNSCRPQVVTKETGLVHDVLLALRRNGVPGVLLNTSFNRRGEPIVDSPTQALDAAASIGLDFLVINGRLVEVS